MNEAELSNMDDSQAIQLESFLGYDENMASSSDYVIDQAVS